MSVPPMTVQTSTTTGDILELFEGGRFSAVPVLDDEGRLAGVISTTDMVQKVIAARDGAEMRAFDLMSAPALVARPEEPIDDAAWRLVAARAHRLVVVDGEEAIGVLSIRDVLGALVHRPALQPIRTIMTRPVTTVDIGASIAHAIHRLAYAGVHGLVVVDEETPVGVFTHAEAFAARHLPELLLEDPVEEIMSAETVCFDVATPIQRVAKAALKMNARRVLVVEDRRLAGIVSDVDLVEALSLAGERR